MNSKQKLGSLVVALAQVLVPTVVAQEKPFQAEPLLLAHLHALDRTALPGAAIETPSAQAAEKPGATAKLFTLSPWSAEKAAAEAAIVPAPRTTAYRPAQKLTFAQPVGTTEARVTPLPPNLPWTTFTHSRVRGPFEQVFPRIW